MTGCRLCAHQDECWPTEPIKHTPGDSIAPPAPQDVRLQKLAIAFHEAAHAALAFLMGCPIDSVTIHLSDGGGLLTFSRPATAGANDGTLMACLAGPLAESIILGRFDPPWQFALHVNVDGYVKRRVLGLLATNEGHCGADECLVLERIIVSRGLRCADAVVETYTDLKDRALRCISSRPVWVFIREIALDLLEHGTLDGAAINVCWDRAAALNRSD